MSSKNPHQIVRDEHDDSSLSKKVNIVSAATINAVVNTTGGSANVTVEQGTSPWVTSFNSGATVVLTSTPTLYAVVNTSAAGVGQSLVSVINDVSLAANDGTDIGDVDVASNTAWSDPKTYLGLVTVDIGANNTVGASFSGNVTLDDGSIVGTVNAVTDITNPVALKGNLTIDSGTVTLAASDGTDIGDVDVASNTAWSDPGTYLGLVTVDIGSAPTFTVDATGQGDVPITLDGESVAVTFSGNVTLDDGSVINTVNAVTDITNPVALKGNVTLDDGSKVALVGNVTIDSMKGYSYAYTSGPTTNWAVKASAGTLHAIHVGAAVGSSVVEVSDHASDGDGNVVLYQAGDTIGPAVYPLNMTMGTGITLDITNQTHVTVVYK